MNPTAYNAFSDGDSNQPAASGTYGKSLASSLSPMQARLTETDFGWSIELSPIRAFDALRLWSPLTADVTTSDGEEPVALLFDVALAERGRLGVRHGSEVSCRLGDVADRLGVATISRFHYGAGDQLVMHEQRLREMIAMVDTTRIRSVLIAGPIEERDGRAIRQAIDAGHSPLEVEFRAVAALEVLRDRVATLHTRSKDHAALLVAENFRHYLAALRKRPATEFATPAASQIRRLLEVSGTITVRPIETDVFSTFIDVGICTAADGRGGPAAQSLIYDVPSDTWHDEA